MVALNLRLPFSKKILKTLQKDLFVLLTVTLKQKEMGLT